MLIVSGLTKKYRQVAVVDNLSLAGKPGEISVLIGPNGAGKTTTINCIAGFLDYSGDIEIFGHVNRSIESKRLLALVPEFAVPFDYLTIMEHMEYIARAYSLGDQWLHHATRLLDRFDLYTQRHKLGHELSKGMKQKLNLCMALLHSPRVIILDEPIVGLDPAAIKELNTVLGELKNDGCCILISTHILSSVAALWDTAYIIFEGRLVASFTREEAEQWGQSLEDVYLAATKQKRAVVM